MPINKIVKLVEFIFDFKYSISKKNQVDYKKFKNIALILTSPLGIGDLIMMIPVINSFRKNFPNSNIELITNHDIFDKLKGVDKINIISGNFLEMSKEFKNLSKNNYDLGVVLARAVNQSFYLNKLNPKWKIGYLAGYKIKANFILKNDDLRFDKNEHFTKNSLKILEAMGIKNFDLSLTELHYDNEITTKADNIFKSLNLPKNKKNIFINAFALWETRRWDEEKYISLIKRLHSKYNFILFGGPDSVELNNKIEKNLKVKKLNLVNIAGKLKLKESISILKHADLFITSDTGPMHMAFMMNVPTLAIFGPVKPEQRMPLTKEQSKICDSIWYGDFSDVDMYNYEKKHDNKEMVGLKAIPIDIVEKKILKLFKEK